MKTIVGALLFVLACSIGQAAGAADAPNSETTTKGGWLREKIKKRILKRVEEKPAPEAKTNIQDPISMPGTYTFTFQHEERTRYYKLHIPKSYIPAKAHALIVAMHGGGGDMEIQATDEYYGFLSASEREGFIVLFPNGYSKYKSGKIATWNAGKCCAWSRDEKVNDVDFIRQAVGHVKAQVKIDSNKIFATGMSNGAMLAYRLACEASDLFRKIAAVAGTDNTLTCQPQKPVSVLHIHSLKDEHVNFMGGAGKDAASAQFITDFVSVPDTIEKWKKLNGCEGPVRKVLAKKNAYCEQATGCRDEVSVKLCVTEDGGHSWPGGSKPMNRGPKPSRALNATQLAWEFFKN